jgi:acyl-homoserine lactone acylase PvdQ
MFARKIRVFGYASALVLLSTIWADATQAEEAQLSEQPDVQNVFAPGQGENLVELGVELPKSFTSQLEMYLSLPYALHSLRIQDVGKFYKSAELTALSPAEIGSVSFPGLGSKIVRDVGHHVPRVYASSRCGAMYGIGFARAEDRLWQMDVDRHTYRASRTEFLGRGAADENLKQDAMTFALVDYSAGELEQMFRELAHRYGKWGSRAQGDIQCYTEGINAFIAITRTDPRRTPIEYRQHGLVPRPWRVTDEVASAAYAHNFYAHTLEGNGVDAVGNARLLMQLIARLGPAVGRDVYNDLREADDPETPVIVSVPFVTRKVARDDRATALPDLGSYSPRSALLRPQVVHNDPAGRVATRSKSNALLVGGTRSLTGHPMAIQGPQDGFGVPHERDSEVQVEAPGIAFRGILEFFGPYPYDGAREKLFAFSGTWAWNSQSDIYVERLCRENHSATGRLVDGYLYRGKCIQFRHFDVTRTVGGTHDTYLLRSLRSVHGPIIGYATVGGTPVAIAEAGSTAFHEAEDFARLAELFTTSSVTGPRDFIRIMSNIPWAVGWYYIDGAHIAFAQSGRIPLRAAGVDSDLPVWGTGAWDWVGFEPVSHTFVTIEPRQHPSAVDPASGVIAGWNNQPARGWPIASTMWALGPYHRVSLLSDPVLRSTRPLDLADIIKIHETAALTDERAQVLYPLIRRMLGTITENPTVESLLREADTWVAAGTFRIDSAKRSELDHGRAVILLDYAWPRIIRNVFGSVLGAEVVDGAGGIGNNLSSLESQPSMLNGWFGYLSKDLRQTLGDRVVAPLSRPYCAHEGRVACRTILLHSVEQALKDAIADYGEDIARWRCLTSCRQCYPVLFPSTGASPPLPPASYQSRPTYEMVTSFH